MRQDLRNSVNGVNGVLARLAAEKKKTVAAVCLIALMAIMWARVLGRKPVAALGADLQEATGGQTSLSDSGPRIFYVELPKTAGRNDVLKRDFFAANGWRNFVSDRQGSGAGEVKVVSKNGSEEVAKRVAGKLRLEAISRDRTLYAYINDKLFSTGDKLVVKEGDSVYECQVVGIDEKSVLIRCGEAQIELRLAQSAEPPR